MNAIITVVGTDQVGIIAEVSALLREYSINIVDISQTILSGNFVMMMMVDLTQSKVPIEQLWEVMKKVSEKLHAEINIMHAGVFCAMHRI